MSRDLTQPLPTPPLRPRREPVRAVIALGANLGDRHATIEAAATRLARLPLVDDLRLSEMVETIALRPEGPDPTAPTYVNAVAIVTTRLAPQILLGLLHAVEEEFGRVRVVHWGDRTLDLDLIDYEGVASDAPDLLLPHPRAQERLFVLEPWLSLDPDAQLSGIRVADLVRALREDAR